MSCVLVCVIYTLLYYFCNHFIQLLMCFCFIFPGLHGCSCWLIYETYVFHYSFDATGSSFNKLKTNKIFSKVLSCWNCIWSCRDLYSQFLILVSKMVNMVMLLFIWKECLKDVSNYWQNFTGSSVFSLMTDSDAKCFLWHLW